MTEHVDTTPSSFAGPDRIFAFADTVRTNDQAETDAVVLAGDRDIWVEAWLAGERYGVPVTAVREIARVSEITRVPHAPQPIRGIVNLRGRVVPVMDLRSRLGLPPADLTGRSRLLIAESRGRLIGLLVDAVERVAAIDRSAIEPPPADVQSIEAQYLVGIHQRKDTLTILLDVERVFVMVNDSEPNTLAVGG